MATTCKASNPGGGRLVVHCLLATLVAFGACGAARAAGAGKLIASSEPGWPQWRGPRRDAVSGETHLLDAWPKGGPKLLWKATGMGRGWCSPIVTGGRLYVGGDVGRRFRIFALDLDGKIKWQVANGKAWKNPFPGGRGSCCYSEGRLYQMNGYGRVICLDAATGDELWVVNVLKRFGAKQPQFGTAECLLVDGANVIVTPGGKKALVAALDKKTGKTVWAGTAAPVAAETAGCSSPILVELGGRRQIIASTSVRTFAADAATGEVLWTSPLKLTKDACSTIPVLCGDSVFITNTNVHKQSTSMLRIGPSGDAAEKAWTVRIGNLSGSAIHVGGNLYLSSSRGLKGYFCLAPETGETKARLPKPVTAAAVWADGKLFILSGDGRALLLKPTATGFQTLGEFPLVRSGKRKDAWAHPVLCDGRLYLRYHDTLFCYDVKAP